MATPATSLGLRNNLRTWVQVFNIFCQCDVSLGKWLKLYFCVCLNCSLLPIFWKFRLYCFWTSTHLPWQLPIDHLQSWKCAAPKLRTYRYLGVQVFQHLLWMQWEKRRFQMLVCIVTHFLSWTKTVGKKIHNLPFHVHLSAAVPENSSTGYLLIATSGGLNQQRIGVWLSSNVWLLCSYHPLCYLCDVQFADYRCCCSCLDFECHTCCTWVRPPLILEGRQVNWEPEITGCFLNVIVPKWLYFKFCMQWLLWYFWRGLVHFLPIKGCNYCQKDPLWSDVVNG